MKKYQDGFLDGVDVPEYVVPEYENRKYLLSVLRLAVQIVVAAMGLAAAFWGTSR